jgi:hypothetical protein
VKSKWRNLMGFLAVYGAAVVLIMVLLVPACLMIAVIIDKFLNLIK